MKIGYARISTGEQSLDPQIEALNRTGCQRIFSDVLSGARADRPGLADALAALGEGDTLVIWRLDRLARSLRHLLDLTADIAERGVGLHSLSEAIETDSAAGRLMLHVLAALTEFERGLISERTKAGLAAARASGAKLGRPSKLTRDDNRYLYVAHSKGCAVSDLAVKFQVNRSTVYRAIAKAPIR